MSDAGKEFAELKREVIEARNQSIKTDNQIKNLSLDVKGFEKRFEVLEKRARYASIGTYAIVACTISIAAYFISSVAIDGVREDVVTATRDAERLKQELVTRTAELDAKQKRIDERLKQEQASATAALQFLGAVESGDRDQAVTLLSGMDTELLSDLEIAVVGPVLKKFRSEAAEAAYRSGTSLRSSGRKSDAAASFRTCLAVAPKGRFSNQARYLLGITLRESRLYKDAIEVFEEIRAVEKDKAVLDEVLYWQGYSHLQVGDAAAGKTILEQVVNSGSRHASAAKTQLASLTPAPQDVATP